MKVKRTVRRRPRIEVIPMIDTVFAVLVFFMVASLAMVRQQGLAVELPQSVTGRPPAEQRITITLERDGSLFLNSTPLPRERLLPALQDALSRAPKAQVVVNADRQARHGGVVDIMDAARLAGAEQVSIATEPREAP